MAASLLSDVRKELRAVADPDKREPMRAYMKSEMPFHGVQMAARRAAFKRAMAGRAFDDADRWQRAVLGLWDGAKFREERYCAIDLATAGRYDAHKTLSRLPMYERMIVEGAWWDYVDWLATGGVGVILAQHRAPMTKKMLTWSRSKDLWKRRTSIICQLRHKKDTDLELLYACIEHSIERDEFFLRKAIGWALREYAKTDPREVVRYVEENADRLSGLSRREALKNVGRPRRARGRR